jgi:hypothetical protein
MPSVLGDESSDSKGKNVGGGSASPPEDAEADSMGLCRPTIASTMEVSEDEAEAYSPTALFQSAAFWATTHHTKDVGASDAVPSPLHLGELPFVFTLYGCLFFKFYLDLTYFDCFSEFDEGPREP